MSPRLGLLAVLGLLACSDEAEHHDRDASWASLPYARIEFERIAAPVWGKPSRGHYTIVLERGGKCRAEGFLPTGTKGSFRGKVSIWSYTRLCRLIEQIGLGRLQSRYESGPTHAEWATLEVYRDADGEPLRIEEYAQSGPITLWAIHRCIDAIAAEIEWERLDGAGQNPR